MKNENKDNSLKIVIILSIFLMVIILCGCIFANSETFSKIISGKNVTNVTKTEKEVTITDNGIRESVEKLYDATVIVEVGSNENNLTGWGSGVVYDKDNKYGYILTNHHVVESSKYIKIVYTDETEVDGELVGSDEIADIAVVKVPVDTIKMVAEVGKSADLQLGDTVFAIGTPVSLSYSFTVTRGILSGKDRLCQMTSGGSSGGIWGFSNQAANVWYMSLLQIDASINSGNSGGPLANANGEVVGINNSKLSSSFGSASIENMGFAIPIEDALNVASQLRENGKVTRPFLGVSVNAVEAADQLGFSVDSSVKNGGLITSVEKGSSADQAGIEAGDVVTKIGDYEIKDYRYFRTYLYRYNVGDKVTFTIIKKGKTITKDITLKS